MRRGAHPGPTGGDTVRSGISPVKTDSLPSRAHSRCVQHLARARFRACSTTRAGSYRRVRRGYRREVRMGAEGEGRHLIDAFGRRLDYLRLSITDRCNFRCSYCLPGGCSSVAGARPLSAGEIDRLVRVFAELGVWKVRLTGGEPTLRQDLVEIVRRVATTPGVRHVGMTTNGHRLASMVRDLAEGGLTCLNVSLDSLDPGRFAAITGRSLLAQVLAGIEGAIAVGIPHIKVNVVLLAGTDGTEVDRFLAWT